MGGIALFVPLKGARITGIKFVGNASTNAIGILADSVEVDNCEITHFVEGIRCGFGDGQYIHHNYIYNVHKALVCGNAKPIWEANLINEANYAMYGDSDTTSSFDMRYNLVLERVKTAIRRGKHENGKSATDKIWNNTFRNTPYVPCGVCGIKIEGNSNTQIYNNWFYGDSISECLDVNNAQTWNNLFATTPSGLNLPSVYISTDQDSGVVPLTVFFSATPGFRTYEWRLGDGTTQTGNSFSHTYNEIGVYGVEVTATDANGSVASYYKYIRVDNNDGKVYLSFWNKDTYGGSQAGLCSLWVEVSKDDPPWGRDVAGDDDWQHEVIDITQFALPPDSGMWISLKAQSKTDALITIFWDDVSLHGYGANVSNGSFENSLAHLPTLNNPYPEKVDNSKWFYRAAQNEHWVYWVYDSVHGYPEAYGRSGNRCFRIDTQEGWFVLGKWVEY